MDSEVPALINFVDKLKNMPTPVPFLFQKPEIRGILCFVQLLRYGQKRQRVLRDIKKEHE